MAPTSSNAAASPTPRPLFHAFAPLQTVPSKVKWSKAEVDAALEEHEQGQFADSALLADAMTRDDTFDAVLATRVLGLLALPRNVEPSLEADARRARKVARMLDEKYDRIFPRSTLADLLKWGILMGFCVAQIVWHPDEDGTEWVPELQVWHPSFVYYRHDLRRYVAMTTEGPVVVEPGDGQWLLYTPFGSDRGWMSGAIRSVAIPWLARLLTWRDWQRWSELYSLGIRKAIAPASASEEDKSSFHHAVSALGAETTVLLTQTIGAENYDVDVLFPSASASADGFERLMNKCETRIAIRLLGQNLTTEVQSGSLAAARVHENVKLELIQADDRTLSEDLRQHVLRPYCRFNFPGGDALAPRLGRKTAPTEDRKNEADTLSGAASALAALLTAGVPVDVRAFADRFGVPLLPAPNPDAAPPTPAPQATSPPTPKKPSDARPHGQGDAAA